MYVPKLYAETNLPTLHEFMREHSFATVVTQQDDAPFASHLPLMLEGRTGSQGALLGHMARNNPQWQHFAAGAEILAIFHGPHAYVTPAWYEPGPTAVPTWNYAAVHAYGCARILQENELEQSLCRLVDENEKGYDPPWQLEITPALRERALSAIVGFEIALHRIEGKFKLGQNRSEQDRRKVIDSLSQTVEGRKVADLMNVELERKYK